LYDRDVRRLLKGFFGIIFYVLGMLSLQSSYEALALTSEAKKKRSCKLHEYTFKSHRIISINCQESAYLKTPCPLPTLARGLFIALTPDGKWDYICARGYDKFFNVTQVKNTQWDWIKENCESEFECTVKVSSILNNKMAGEWLHRIHISDRR
jgi:tRNA splicing ligase